MKSILFPHGDRYKMKKDVFKNSATAQFDVISLVCSMPAVLQFRLGCIHLKGRIFRVDPYSAKYWDDRHENVNLQGVFCGGLLKFPIESRKRGDNGLNYLRCSYSITKVRADIRDIAAICQEMGR